MSSASSFNKCHCYKENLFSKFIIVVIQSCPTLCNPMNCSTPVHCLLELAQTHVHWVSDAIQPSHPLLPLSPLAVNFSQHQGLFQWISSWSMVRWPKYWSLSFSISPSSEYSRLITQSKSGLYSFIQFSWGLSRHQTGTEWQVAFCQLSRRAVLSMPRFSRYWLVQPLGLCLSPRLSGI